MAFTKFLDDQERQTITREELAKHPYFMLIYLGDEYSVNKSDLEIIKLHLERLNDYVAIIITSSDCSNYSEVVQPLVSEFTADTIGSFVGVGFLSNIDKDTGKIKIIKKELPNPNDTDKTTIVIIGSEIDHVINVVVPLSDKKSILSKLTLDRILKVIGMAI